MALDQVLRIVSPDETDYAGAAVLDQSSVPDIDALVGGSELGLASKAVFLASLIEDPAATAVVTRAATSTEVPLRVASAAAARHLPEDVATRVLEDLARDPYPGVRKNAIESAGMVATDSLRQLLNDVAAADPVEELRDLGRSIVKRVGSGVVAAYQQRINEVTRRAKRRPFARSRAETVLTDDDIDFLDELYGRITLAGRVVAPEASQLLRRYMRPGSSGVEEVPSDIYENSPRVQSEMDWHKAQIAKAAQAGRVPLKGGTSNFAVNGEARISEACGAPRGARKPTRILLADGERLQKANNRFYLQSYSVRREESKTLETRFVVTDCYRFEPFHKKLYTEFDVLGLKLRLEDGLGEYLTRIGKAKIFTYESTWEQPWTP
jgi:hypothetical protein